MKSLAIQDKIKGNNNIDSAATISNIGSVYSKQKNYSKAL